MSNNDQDRALALAGIFQAAFLVQQVATRGLADAEQLETCINSLFVSDPEQAADTYGGVDKLRTGLELIRSQLGSEEKPRDMDLARYVIALLHLERNLAKRRDMLNTIADGLEDARRQTEHFAVTHENVIANLADLYLHTISTLTPRIIVSGAQGYLNQTGNANKVRALLLAGIRSAVLWRQSGGSRLKLLFGRKALLQAVEKLLAETN